MLSTRLVQLIEDHADNIAAGIVRSYERDERLTHLRNLPASDLRARCLEILRRFGYWLTTSREEEIAREFGPVGRLCAHQDIPLHEVVHGLHVMKRHILDYIRGQGLDLDTVSLYAEEELEHQVGSFFDSVVYYEVFGYDSQLGRRARPAVSAAG